MADSEQTTEHTKVRIAMQGLEVEAQGSQEFVQRELPALVENFIEKMSELQRAAGPSSALPPNADSGKQYGGPSGQYDLFSTNTIASLSNVSTGSDLVMAAMACITLVQRKDTAARHEILEQMKSAKTFYKESYSGNLTSYLDRLAKAKRLNLVAKETYALPNSERQQFTRLIENES